jgi:peptidoglycan/LPS O-acetylase OafA/YrhL
MFLCFHQYREQLGLASRRWTWLGILIAAVAMLVALMAHFPMSAMTLTLVYIVPFAVIVFFLAAIEVNEKPLAIRTPLLLLLGEASYSLYLAHQQYGLALFPRLFDARIPGLGLIWSIVLTVALSIGLYKLIEKPARTMMNHYVERLQFGAGRSEDRLNCAVHTTSTSVLP